MKDGAYEHQKKSMLDISDFYTLLRKVGFKCLQKNCKVIYSRLELELIVNNALNEMKWIKTKTADYLDDVTYAVPYFRVIIIIMYGFISLSWNILQQHIYVMI